MHGLIFAGFRDYVAARAGLEQANEAFGDRIYSLSEDYADEEFGRLAEAARAVQDVSMDSLLDDFGRYTGEVTFPRIYPSFYTVAGDTRSFLLTIEDRIHELVRATIPNARPPQLRVEAIEPGGVRIVYDSPRRLCRLLEGLVVGTAAHFGETAEIEQTACMHDGASACVFDVRLRTA